MIQLLREKCWYSEFPWSVFSRIRTEYVEIFFISLYSVRMRENAVQKNSEYGHFLRSKRILLENGAQFFQVVEKVVDAISLCFEINGFTISFPLRKLHGFYQETQ